MTDDDTISAREAARQLGVQVRTLYAYVSRGRLESLPGPGRARRYRRADIERLDRDRQSDAARALDWGQPVLDTAITEISARGPVYRGRPAVALAADGVAFERVAELLWSGALPPSTPAWPLADAPPAPVMAADPIARFAVLVPWLAAHDPGRFNRRPAAVIERARGLIARLARALAGADDPADRIAARLATAWVGDPATAPAIDAALVLWADHELNVSAFAARVAASAHADVYACVSAGLAALSGPRHGTRCEQIDALVAQIDRPERAAEVVHARLRRGEPLPGFGHPLYPDGDPRATALLRVVERLPSRPRVDAALALAEVVGRECALAPDIDLATTALAAALGRPAREAPGLIAIGRAAGWAAHALEQYESGELIRPRARFRGEAAPR